MVRCSSRRFPSCLEKREKGGGSGAGKEEHLKSIPFLVGFVQQPGKEPERQEGSKEGSSETPRVGKRMGFGRRVKENHHQKGRRGGKVVRMNLRIYNEIQQTQPLG